MMKPDWSISPEWAKWLAQWEDGRWQWFSRKPRTVVRLGVWLSQRYSGALSQGAPGYEFRTPNDHWMNTLEHRPRKR